MARKTRGPQPDEEWLRLAQDAVAPWGMGSRIARLMNVEPSTVSRITSGALKSPDLLLRFSLEAGIRPPRSAGLSKQEQKLLVAFAQLRQMTSEKALEPLVDDIESLAREMRDAARKAFEHEKKVREVDYIHEAEGDSLAMEREGVRGAELRQELAGGLKRIRGRQQGK